MSNYIQEISNSNALYNMSAYKSYGAGYVPVAEGRQSDTRLEISASSNVIMRNGIFCPYSAAYYTNSESLIAPINEQDILLTRIKQYAQYNNSSNDNLISTDHISNNYLTISDIGSTTDPNNNYKRNFSIHGSRISLNLFAKAVKKSGYSYENSISPFPVWKINKIANKTCSNYYISGATYVQGTMTYIITGNNADNERLYTFPAFFAVMSDYNEPEYGNIYWYNNNCVNQSMIHTAATSLIPATLYSSIEAIYFKVAITLFFRPF